VFREIAEACAGLDAQLVVSMGRADAPLPTDLPGDPVVVGYAPNWRCWNAPTWVFTNNGDDVDTSEENLRIQENTVVWLELCHTINGKVDHCSRTQKEIA
jgi:hypothetical protein